MTKNLTRFKTDLDRLLEESDDLRFSAHRLADKESFDALVIKIFPDDKEKREMFIKHLPKFRMSYEAWYSESLSVIDQLLPTRLADFKAQYEIPRGRREITNANYVVNDLLQGLSGGTGRVQMISGLPRLDMQINILKAARRRFESSLFEIRQLLQADLFDTEIDAAQELLRNGFSRAAGAIAGVVLEAHLKQVCADHAIVLRTSKPTLAVLNDALKDASTITVPQWRYNQHLADIRNQCNHARGGDPDVDDIKDLIEGVRKVLKTIL